MCPSPTVYFFLMALSQSIIDFRNIHLVSVYIHPSECLFHSKAFHRFLKFLEIAAKLHNFSRFHLLVIDF